MQGLLQVCMGMPAVVVEATAMQGVRVQYVVAALILLMPCSLLPLSALFAVC